MTCSLFFFLNTYGCIFDIINIYHKSNPEWCFSLCVGCFFHFYYSSLDSVVTNHLDLKAE